MIEAESHQELTSHKQIDHSPFFESRYHWIESNLFADAKDEDDFFFQKRKKLFGQLKFDKTISDHSLLQLLPSPDHFKDIDKCATRVIDAVQKKQRIIIFGDYDVDGTTSSAMLYLFFLELKANVEIYIPDRIQEGYGFNVISLEKIVQLSQSLNIENPNLIITVDNGISSLTACERATQLGIDVIITDHHEPPPQLPHAFAILNPKQPGCDYPFKGLAGVGVAFYLMIAVRKKAREHDMLTNQLPLKEFLDFVAIGTIADMAPLVDVNHILCRTGLEVLNHHIRINKRPGLKALYFAAQGNKDQTLPPANAHTIGFKIGPRLNAAGRLGTALKTVELLTTTDEIRAQELAHFLHEENGERQKLEKAHTAEAISYVLENNLHKSDALVVFQESWHPGVIGLVASRILEKFYKPTLVFTLLDGKLKGSGRSTHAFDLFSALNNVREKFVSFGGHFHAVGLTMEKEHLEWLQNYLHEQVQIQLEEKDKRPHLTIDGQLFCEQVNISHFEKLTVLEPFGIGNPMMKWLLGPVQVKRVKRIGKNLEAGHAHVLLQDENHACWVTLFNHAERFEKYMKEGFWIKVVLEGKLESWNNRLKADVRVLDDKAVLK